MVTVADALEAQKAAAYNRGLLRAAELAEERARLLREQVSAMLAASNYGKFGAQLDGGAVWLEEHAAKCRALAAEKG